MAYAIAHGEYFLPNNCTQRALNLLQRLPNVFSAPQRAYVINHLNLDQERLRHPLLYGRSIGYECLHVIFLLSTGRILPFFGTLPEDYYIRAALTVYDPTDSCGIRRRHANDRRFADHVILTLQTDQILLDRYNLVNNRNQNNADRIERALEDDLAHLRGIIRSSFRSNVASVREIYRACLSIIRSFEAYQNSVLEVEFEMSKLHYKLTDILNEVNQLDVNLQLEHLNINLDPNQQRGGIPPIAPARQLVPPNAGVRRAPAILDLLVDDDSVTPENFSLRIRAIATDIQSISHTRMLAGNHNVLGTEDHRLLEIIHPNIYRSLLSCMSGGPNRPLNNARSEEFIAQVFGRNQNETTRLLGCKASVAAMLQCVRLNLPFEAAFRAIRTTLTPAQHLLYLQQVIAANIPGGSVLRAELEQENPLTLTLRSDISTTFYAIFKFHKKYSDNAFHHNRPMNDVDLYPGGDLNFVINRNQRRNQNDVNVWLNPLQELPAQNPIGNPGNPGNPPGNQAAGNAQQ